MPSFVITRNFAIDGIGDVEQGQHDETDFEHSSSDQESASRCALAGQLAIMLLIQVATTVLDGFIISYLPEYGWHCDVELYLGALTSWLGALALLGIFGLFLHLQGGLHEHSPLLTDVQRYIVLSWLALLNMTFYCVTWAGSHCGASWYFHVNQFASGATMVFLVLLPYLYARTMEKRVALTERAFGEPLGSYKIRILSYIGLVGNACFSAGILCNRVRVASFDEFKEKFSLVWSQQVFCAVYYFMLAALVSRSFTSLMYVATCATKRGTGYAKAEATWAQGVLSSLRWSMVIPCIVMATFSFLEFGFACGSSNHFNDIMIPLRQTGAAMVEAVCLLRVVGLFQEQKPLLQLQPLHGTQMISSLVHELHSDAWEEKLRKLASRSIEVGALVAFHAQLGSNDVMPHYDPWRSTTNDVVRQAIIPLSRTQHGGVAYAEMLKQDALPAQCLVTHTWSSIFVDLVAAVVADALGLKDYAEIADALAAGRHAALLEELSIRGNPYQAYWLCAFCINQHAGICGGFAHEPPQGTVAHAKWDSSRKDSVTGDVFMCCDCNQPKFFNDSPDECELNKFDHMMSLLQKEVPGFCQLVVVDRKFEVFSRIWCVAELVQAYLSGMQQRVQLCSCEGLRDDAPELDIYIKLATMTVAEAEATRAEDKDAILRRIENIPDFDAHLQFVIFGGHGLLSRCFVGFGILEAAAHTARRMRALSRAKSFD